MSCSGAESLATMALEELLWFLKYLLCTRNSHIIYNSHNWNIYFFSIIFHYIWIKSKFLSLVTKAVYDLAPKSYLLLLFPSAIGLILVKLSLIQILPQVFSIGYSPTSSLPAWKTPLSYLPWKTVILPKYPHLTL